MLPDAKWLEALKLPLNVNIAIALSSATLIACDRFGYLDFGVSQQFVRPILIVLLVVFGALSFLGLIEPLLAPVKERQKQRLLDIRHQARVERKRDKENKSKKQVLDRLDTLSKEEIRRVADCIRSDSPTFFTYVSSPPVTVLMGKGLVWTPGGQHHQDHYPFSFHDFVWEKILERREEFLEKDGSLNTKNQNKRTFRGLRED